MSNGLKTPTAHRVDELMAEGKASHRSAWVMSEILDTLEHESGEAAREEAREYIIEYCGMKEGD
jgi:hypothetical protein